MESENSNRSLMQEEAGKYCLDLSKLVFGGVILVGIMDLSINITALLIVGVVIVAILAYTGFAFLKLSNTKKK